jgi:hypothetical protein
MALLLVSAICAIVTNMPLFYESVRTEELRSAVTDLWGEKPNDAMQRVAVTHVKEIESARDRNTKKAWLLTGALGLQILGLLSLGWTVYQVIHHGAT